MAEFHTTASPARSGRGIILGRITSSCSSHVTATDFTATLDAASIGPEGRWIHYGMTSSDVLDTGFALQLPQSDPVDDVEQHAPRLPGEEHGTQTEEQRRDVVPRSAEIDLVPHVD